MENPMRKHVLLLALASAVALASCETSDGGGYGYGSAPAHRTQLSQCGRNAIIGGLVGAAVGVAQDSRHNRAENAALGAAGGAGGTYAVCRILSAHEQQRVENAYYQSLNSGQGVNENWQSDQGAPRSLAVAPPQPSDKGAQCRTVNATVTDQQYGNQQLPPETFCRDANGQWTPA